MFDREVNYVPSNSTATTFWEITLRLLEEKKVTLKPFVSMRVSMDNWKTAFGAVMRKKVYKAVLFPDNDFSES